MALQAVVLGDGYRYTQAVDKLNAAQIEDSIEQFNFFKATKVIISGEYDSNQWIITDEVRASVTINLAIDEVHFQREAAQKLSCTCAQYEKAMRIAITSRFGFSLHTLQNDANCLSSFANTFALPKNYSAAQLLIDVLELLPGNSKWRKHVIEELQTIPAPKRTQSRQQRTLAVYQSYFRFNDLLDRFWTEATQEEKNVY